MRERRLGLVIQMEATIVEHQDFPTEGSLNQTVVPADQPRVEAFGEFARPSALRSSQCNRSRKGLTGWWAAWTLPERFGGLLWPC
jgi:hypothetical protein